MFSVKAVWVGPNSQVILLLLLLLWLRSSYADATFVLSDLCICCGGVFTQGLSSEGGFRKENLSISVVIAGFNSLFRMGG